MSDLTLQWLLVALDVSVKAILLAGTAALVLRFRRLRDSNLRHRVWTGVLVGMLVLPALSQIVPVLRLPFQIPDSWRIAEADGASAPVAVEPSTTDVAQPVTGEPLDDFPQRPFADEDINHKPLSGFDTFAPPESEFESDAGLAAAPPAETAEPVETVDEKTNGEETVAASGVPMPPSGAAPPRWPVVLLTIWLAGACVMALRLLIGIIYSCRLVWCSTAITAEELSELGVDARTLSSNGRAVPIGECPLICVPLAIGVFRPRILLPSQWLGWSAEKLQAVITHERTHIQRADGAVIFLAELNRCVYWFHPLAWWLRSHLGQLAETACDDAAIDCTGDRTTYARHLLEVAAAVSEGRSRLLPVGISMARPSHIESRINTILDFARPLSKRLTWATSLLLLAAMIPLIALAAAVRPATEAVDEQQPEEVITVDDEAEDEVAAAEDDETKGRDSGEADAQVTIGKQQIDTTESSASPIESAKPAGDAEDPSFTYAGTVVDEEGEPVAGAKLSMNYWRKTFPPADAPPLAVTDDEGKFEFQRRLSDFADAGVSGGSSAQSALVRARLIAQREGHGLATGRAAWFETSGALQEEFDQWLENQPGRLRRYLERLEKEPTTVLTLVPDDVPVRGRIVDTEGQPVQGAKIEAVNIHEGKDGNLDAWAEESARSDATYYTAREHLDQVTTNNWISGPRSVEIPPLQTDAEGRFTLRGLGRERIVEIYISGPGIETRKVSVRTRPGGIIRLAKSDRPSEDLGAYVYYPSEFTHVAGPSVPVEGRVTGKQTGEPLAGLDIITTRIATSRIGGTNEARYIQATTDEEGTYRLEGLPIGRNEFQLVAPAESGYMPAGFTVTLAADASRHVQDIELTRGIVVRGQVTDSRTGQPVTGTAAYFAFSTNPHLEKARSFRRADVDHAYRTDELGRYEIPVLPGSGVLAFRAEPGDSYPRGVGAEQIEGPSEPAGSVNLYRTVPSLLLPRNYNLVIPLDPEPGTDELTRDLTLTSGVTIPGEVLSPDGEVLSDYYIFGDDLPMNWSSSPYGGKVFDISGYLPTEPRRVMIYHPETNLVGMHVLSGPPPEKVRITLQPGAILKGRAVDQDGLPLENVQISNESPWAKNTEYGLLLTRLGNRHITTDEAGRFEIPGIIPGLKYGADAIGSRKFGNQTVPTHLGILFTDVTAESGETKDLGEVRAKPREEDAAGTQAVPKDKSSSDDASTTTRRDKAAGPPSYSGHIRTSDGKPIGGATVWLAVRPWGRDAEGSVHRLGTSDAKGRFHVELDADTSQAIGQERPRARTHLVATAAGHGLDRLPPEVFVDQPTEDEKRDELRGRIDAALGAGRFAGRTLLLRPQERPVRGRLIDLDGRPLAGVTVQVEQLSHPDVDLLLKAFEESSKDRYYGALRATHYGSGLGRSELQQLIPAVVTDDDGRFELAGIGRDQLVSLSLAGDRVEARLIHVLGRDMEMVRIPHIDRYPGGAKDVYAGRDFTYAVGPSVPVEGVVTDFDTGEPVANTLVSVERLFRREGRDEQVQLWLDTAHMRAVTDEQGRFRITGMPPGEGHVLEARPPTTRPYLNASHEISLGLENEDSKLIEIQVKQGIWIEGTVTDLRSGQPLSGTVDYLALQKNPHTLDKLGLKQAWEIGRFNIDDQGRYRVSGLPGPGVVLVRAAGGYPRSVGAESVDGFRDIGGGYIPTTPIGLPLSNWNFIKQIDPAPEATSFTCDVQLDAGQSVPGRVVGPDGAPVADVKVLGEIANNAFWTPHYDGTFLVEGYDGEGPRQLFFKSPDKTLVGQFRLVGETPKEIVVTLQRSISVTGRLIENETDLPAARYGLHCEKSSLFNEKFRSTRFRIEDCITDDEGHFEIRGLIPGLVYEMNAANEQHFVNNRNRFQIDLTRATPGEAIELGDVTGPDRNAAQRGEEDDAKAESARDDSTSPNVSKERVPKADESGETEASASELIEIRGRVVTPDDQPVSGAKVWAWWPYFDEWTIVARSDAEGSFRAELDRKPLDEALRKNPRANIFRLWVTAEGYGCVSTNLDVREPDQAGTIQLAAMHPIEGRILDMDGHAVVGAKIRVAEMGRSGAEEVEEYLEGLRHRSGWGSFKDQRSRMYFAGPNMDEIWTDENGRFRIDGLPAESVVKLELEGPGIANDILGVITRGPPPGAGEHGIAFANTPPRESAFCSRFTYLGVPGRTIRGVVRDAATHDPLAGVRVSAFRNHSQPLETDEEGRFEATGIPKQEEYQLGISAIGLPYFNAHPRVADTLGLEPIEIEVDLIQGLLVRGKVTDAATGKAVAGTVEYNALFPNEHVDTVANPSAANPLSVAPIAEDGTYELTVLPGPGVIGAREYTNDARYLAATLERARVVNLIGENNLEESDGPYVTYVPRAAGGQSQGAWSPGSCHAAALINPPVDSETLEVDLQFVPGVDRTGTIVNAAGDPVTGALIMGLQRQGGRTSQPLETAEFTVTGLSEHQQRDLIVFQPERNLGAWQPIDAGETGPITITLAPCGTIVGRFVDEFGELLSEIAIEASPEPPRLFNPGWWRATTDEDGRFRIEGIVPDCPFRLLRMRGQKYGGGVAQVAGDIKVRSGETKDLGEFVRDRDGRMKRRMETKQSSMLRDSIVSGRVTNSDGQPVAGIAVAVVARRVGPSRGGDLSPRGEVLAAGMSDENGRFELTLEGVSGKTHRYAAVIARTDGSAVAWEQINLDAAKTEASLRLEPEEVIRGRLIDIDGRAADGVRLSVRAVMKTVTDAAPPTEGVGYRGGEEAPAAWMPTATSNEQGRFAIHGVPARFGVWVETEGNDRFGPQQIALNTGIPGQRGERDATYRALVKNVEPGEEAVLALSPAQVFEGVVTYEDTDEPAPHARVTIWASQQEQGGSMVSVAGKADAQGRYRITPKPGIRFGVRAYPPKGVPYLAARGTPSGEGIRWQTSDRVKRVDVSLPRGVLVQGQIVEAGSGEPVSGASIQYKPESVNNDFDSDGIATGANSIQISDEDGQFEIAVLPGPGRLLAHGPDATYVLQGIGTRELSRNRPGGLRRYAHAIERIDLEPDADVVPITFELQKGMTVSGRLVDEQGVPIDEILVITRLKAPPYMTRTLIWSAGELPPTRGGRFELTGLGEDEEYTVCFLDARNRRGTTVQLQGTDEEPTVVLEPCGQANVRFVDDEGRPVAHYHPSLVIVVRPGEDNELNADSDLIQNVDRTNYSRMPKSDENGEVVLPALIPGANYRLVIRRDGKPTVTRDFQVESSKTLDLGEMVVDRPE